MPGISAGSCVAVARLSRVDEPTSSGRVSSALLWSSLFAPGLICVGLGVFVAESTVVIVVGVGLLLVPLLLQVFAADWSREHIPEHSHDHHHAPPPEG